MNAVIFNYMSIYFSISSIVAHGVITTLFVLPRLGSLSYPSIDLKERKILA
jgi:hypothetical protein